MLVTSPTRPQKPKIQRASNGHGRGPPRQRNRRHSQRLATLQEPFQRASVDLVPAARCISSRLDLLSFFDPAQNRVTRAPRDPRRRAHRNVYCLVLIQIATTARYQRSKGRSYCNALPECFFTSRVFRMGGLIFEYRVALDSESPALAQPAGSETSFSAKLQNIGTGYAENSSRHARVHFLCCALATCDDRTVFDSPPTANRDSPGHQCSFLAQPCNRAIGDVEDGSCFTRKYNLPLVR